MVLKRRFLQMKKLAVFVEGNTEALFIIRLLEEIAGRHRARIEHRQIRGGSTTRRTLRLVTAIKPDTGQEFFVLLYDCGSDEGVKARILEEHQNLTRGDYS